MMTFTPASTASVIAFQLILLIVITAVLVGVYVSNQRLGRAPLRPTLKVAFGLAVWLGILSVIVARGFLQTEFLPRIPLFFAAVNGAAIAFALSPVGTRLTALPLAALVGFQAFRLPLELVLHKWAEEGTIPTTMTWTGQNWDIVTGVLAILTAVFAGRSPRFVWLTNVIGSILLLNVARVALFSSPLPFAWQVEPPLLLAAYMPYALIAPVCVAGALGGHIILTRALLRPP